MDRRARGAPPRGHIGGPGRLPNGTSRPPGTRRTPRPQRTAARSESQEVSSVSSRASAHALRSASDEGRGLLCVDRKLATRHATQIPRRYAPRDDRHAGSSFQAWAPFASLASFAVGCCHRRATIVDPGDSAPSAYSAVNHLGMLPALATIAEAPRNSPMNPKKNGHCRETSSQQWPTTSE